MNHVITKEAEFVLSAVRSMVIGESIYTFIDEKLQPICDREAQNKSFVVFGFFI